MIQIKNRQQMLVIGAIAIVALFAADKIILSPLGSWWKSRSEALVAIRKRVADGEQLIRREDGLRSRWNHMQTNTLPRNDGLAQQQLIESIDRWSRDSRISVTAITPQWKKDSEDYITLECRVDATGTVDTLRTFIYDIEKDPLGLKLESLEVTARDKEGKQLALGLQISGLVLSLGEKQP